MSSFVTKISCCYNIDCTFIYDHDTRSLHYNGSVLMLEGERLACDGCSVSQTYIML